MPSQSRPMLGITMGASRGSRTSFRFSGQRGLDEMSIAMTMASDEPAEFQARITSIPIEDIAFEDIALAKCSIERSAADVAGSGLELVRVIFLRDGVMHLRNTHGSVRVEARQMVAVPMWSPFTVEFEGKSRQHVLTVPEKMLRLLPGRVELDRLKVLAPGPSQTMLAAMMQALVHDAPEDNTVESELVAHALADLAHAVVCASGKGTGSDSADAALRLRVYDLIEREYNDRELSTGSIAARLSLSPRNLQRLFANEPRSIAATIRSRRLAAIERDLLLTRDTFASIAHQAGFGSDDSAYRAFRDDKGMSPAEYRRGGPVLGDAKGEE